MAIHDSHPKIEGNFDLDKSVIEALPVPGTRVISAHIYGMSVWARPARIVCQLPNGEIVNYFLKVTTGESDRVMSEGQYESDKAIHAVSPAFAPKTFAWGKYQAQGPPHYFLLAEFREIGQQPPEPTRLASRLAEFHKNSVSPTGKFGFHTTTCHGKITQITDCWEDLWEKLYHKQLTHMFELDIKKHGTWSEFEFLSQLVLDKCIPRLLRPLQMEGRTIRPCLVHGNIWDENTATDIETGEPFVFDGSAFYGHNEYELGNWRSPRHRLSSKTYIRSYKRHFPASEPEEDWDSRNLLYSLRFNVGAGVLIPGSNYRELVFEDLKELCRRICPEDLAAFQSSSKESGRYPDKDQGEEEEEEEEEEE
ncbi:MAG: hypothetical protein Q9187_002589 [Circinaria calcarea]